jgi:hypothetical protein
VSSNPRIHGEGAVHLTVGLEVTPVLRAAPAADHGSLSRELAEAYLRELEATDRYRPDLPVHLDHAHAHRPVGLSP